MQYLLNINNIDQSITLGLNGSDSLFWDNFMLTITNTWSWSLLILMLLYILFKNNSIRNVFFILISIGIMIFVADRLCSGLIKPMVSRWRPTQDPQIMYLVDTVRDYRGGRFGFFSGHACNTMCVAMFLSHLFKSRKLSFALFFWSITTTYTRIYLGVHYFGDITIGWIVGSLIGYVFYKLYSRLLNREEQTYLSSGEYTESGYKKTDLNNFIAVIIFNYILLIIISLTIGIK